MKTQLATLRRPVVGARGEIVDGPKTGDINLPQGAQGFVLGALRKKCLVAFDLTERSVAWVVLPAASLQMAQ